MNMTIPIVISIITLIFSIYVYLTANNKNNTTELTTVIVKLENIGNGIADIKAEINSMKNEQKEDHDRLIKLESSVTTLWKRMDEIKEKGYANL